MRVSQHPVSVRLAFAGVLAVAAFSMLFLRLWALTVLSGDHYTKLAENNQIRKIVVEGPRGAIIDRNGRPLVTNQANRQVIIDLQDVPQQRRERLYRDLSGVIDVPATEIRRMVNEHKNDPLSPVVVQESVRSLAVVLYLEEHRRKFPGVRVRDRFTRNYIEGQTAAHILGQVGEVTAEQLKTDFTNLKPGDRVGQTGIERSYDQYLRGVDGYRAIEVDAAGVPQGVGRGVPASPGRNLRLTIDVKLQRRAELALMEGINLAHRTKDGARANAGAAVAMDPRNGEILALASYPGYNPNIFVTPGNDAAIGRLFADERTPMNNRAISGLYPPGSVFKPITGIAAMVEGFVKPDTLLPCPSYMNIAGKRFNNWMDESLGAMPLAAALEVSCDTYFYKLALDFYNQPGSPLQDWSRKFGLGTATAVDLPGEEEGLVPTPGWRRKAFEGSEGIWSPGHSVNLSIGQGDLLVTPLQMTRVYAALANGGTLYTPRVAKSIEDPGGTSLMNLAPPREKQLQLTPEILKPIRDGLYRAANGGNGTSTAVFGSFPIDVSGKTGTAEKPPHGDMAWYCAYGPSGSPTVVACAVIEAGGHGGEAAAPVVLRMFQQYFGVQGGNVVTNRPSD